MVKVAHKLFKYMLYNEFGYIQYKHGYKQCNKQYGIGSEDK